MSTPVLYPRSLDDIMAELAAHAGEYTPEWRYEGKDDDPGSAIARLFGEMFSQTAERLNAVPEKLYTEFLELCGVQMPDPIPAEGLLLFTAHDTVEKAVPVPSGTQIFTEDAEGLSIIYETSRRIEATPAKIKHILYADPRESLIEELDPARPQKLFAPNGGENLRRHVFSVSQNDVLMLDGACIVELEISAENKLAAAETVQLLADPRHIFWSYTSGGAEVPFDETEARLTRIILKKNRPGALDLSEDGNIYISCTNTSEGGSVVLDGVRIVSSPAERIQAQSLSFGDVPIEQGEGGYCFGRRPSAYALMYIRSDLCFCKRGADVNVRFDITPIVTEPSSGGPQYSFRERIIDKQGAVTIEADDVFVEEVIWEYFNGAGWTRLHVGGNKNPFSCKTDGNLEMIFTVPGDISAAEVNAEEGFYIRARVVHIENEGSFSPRWIVPFVREVSIVWHYAEEMPISGCRAENNGSTVEMHGIESVARLQFPAFVSMAEEPRGVYICFDRSPDAMPLSLLFELAGRAALDDKPSFEMWTGKRFEQARSIDLTRNFYHTGLVLLYMTKPIPEAEFFGRRGFWLRIMRSSYTENSSGYPLLNSLRPNIAEATQRKREEEQWFDTEIYDADKVITLLETPVQDCTVWIDEAEALAVGEVSELLEAMPGRVRPEYEDGILAHCWILWERQEHLALVGADTRGYELDPYEGRIVFGNGTNGRVPPPGERNICVLYKSGGGMRGNVPSGAVTKPVGALPKISAVENVTPMSGGTGKMDMKKLNALGNRRLRHRNRALGVLDFEEMVSERFPQTAHVKCFSGRAEDGKIAPGHVTVVIEMYNSESSRGAAELCRRIYEYLEPIAGCTLTAGRRLHVVPSTVITVNTDIEVEMENLDEAAATQQEIQNRIALLINELWRRRDIGDQIRVSQLWQTVRDTPNVRLIKKLLIEGTYEENGISRSIPLEDDSALPYATVLSGTHIVKLS